MWGNLKTFNIYLMFSNRDHKICVAQWNRNNLKCKNESRASILEFGDCDTANMVCKPTP